MILTNNYIGDDGDERIEEPGGHDWEFGEFQLG